MTFQINIVDNEASEPVLSFYNETTTANEHEYEAIYIVVDGDIHLGDVGGVAPTFTWEIVQGSSNAAIIDEAEHTGSYDDHAIDLSGDVTFNETDRINIDGNGNRQAKVIYYRAANDSRSEPEEQLEIRFKSASNTHCAITGGTHATHIHKITDHDINGVCDYGDCYPEPYFSSATATKNETGTSGNIGHTFTINLNGITEIVPSTLNINLSKTLIIGKTLRNGEYFYIGKNGNFIKSNQLNETINIPSVFGEFRIEEYIDLQNILSENEVDLQNIEKYFYYKNKRWDLLFSNKLTLMLPSQNVAKSIKIYKKLLDSDNLINKKIIDLRITNQIILTNYNE